MSTVKQIAQEKGWDYEKNYAYGKVGHYLVTIHQLIDYISKGNTGKYLYLPLLGITKEQAGEVYGFLKENKKAFKLNSYEFSGHVLVIRFSEILKTIKTQDLDNLLTPLIDFIVLHEIAMNEICIYCEQANPETVTKIKKIAYPAHHACVREAEEKSQQSQEQYKHVNKHYLLGSIGALIGGFIGSIPWIILSITWGYASILALLIGYSAYYGYKLVGGKLSALTKYIILVVVLINIVLANFISNLYALIDGGFEVSLYNFQVGYSNFDLFLGGLVISLVFALLGFISVFSKIKMDEKQ